MAAVRDDTIVVFLIGMPTQPLVEGPSLVAGGTGDAPDVDRAGQDPASGFLGGTGALTRNGPMLVQYWESVEKLLGGKAAAGIAKHKPRSQNQAPAARKILEI